MTCHDVCKKPHHQYKWLQENSKYFEQCDYRQHINRHTGHCKNVSPVIFISVVKCNDKVNVASTNGTAMLPVTFAPPGKIGINPSKLFIQIKKKMVSR